MLDMLWLFFAVYFIVGETLALVFKGRTLSDQVWFLIGAQREKDAHGVIWYWDHSLSARIRRIVLYLAAVWAFTHLFTGGWV